MTLAIDPAWLAELTAELATYGYKVTKARAPRASTSTEPGRADGCTPAKAPKGHDRCAEHWKVPGMRKPVCIVTAGATIREDGRDTGELVPDAWTDADTVLAFAVDVTGRKPRGPVGYAPAEQSSAVPWYRSTYDPTKASRHALHAVSGEAWNRYGLHVGCEDCAAGKARAEAAA